MTAIRERPILFSAPMVRSILAGNKTQTRRVVKPQPESSGEIEAIPPVPLYQWRKGKDWFAGVTAEQLCSDKGLLFGDRCPYGQSGDRLWVRETWQPMCTHDECLGENIRTGAGLRVNYRATDQGDEVTRPNESGLDARVIWRPSIHMPRWASRIILEVQAVRAERLHDISHDDIKAEGVLPFADAWRRLWIEINGRDSWDLNPWVWVVEFTQISDVPEH